MRRRIAAIAAAIMLALTGLGIAPTRATAAIWGCSTGNDSKVVAGTVYYRSWAVCYGTPPKDVNYYRIRAKFSILGTGQGDIIYHGPWVKASSGAKSRTKWVAWPLWANAEGRQVRTK